MRWALAAVAVVAVLLGVVLVGPRLLCPPLTDRELDRQAVTGGKHRIKLKREQGQRQNDARTTLLQVLAGGALLLGANFTWRQVQTAYIRGHAPRPATSPGPAAHRGGDRDGGVPAAAGAG